MGEGQDDIVGEGEGLGVGRGRGEESKEFKKDACEGAGPKIDREKIGKETKGEEEKGEVETDMNLVKGIGDSLKTTSREIYNRLSVRSRHLYPL